MTQEEAKKLKPFDVVIYTDKEKSIDLLVKSVTENGVFCLERIQSTAVLYKLNQTEK